MKNEYAQFDLSSQPILELTVVECCEIAKGLLGLLGDDMSADAEHLTGLLAAKSGAKMLVKQACSVA